MEAYFGQQALLSMSIHLVFFAVSFWALQALNFEKFLRTNRVAQARLLYILLSIVIGTTVSEFFLNYLSWARQLSHIF
ncbi:DUF1146 family protein [Bacillus sp. 2205SS5-2]|uniref:DUF1146 family protein n=1 Tax=Bacillus sp. 2205SS5-2 TaxID=3109031 RepID=UPI0030060991